MEFKGKKVKLELNIQEVELMLRALGKEQQVNLDRGYKANHYEWLINKIYRAMGVKL